MELNSMNGRMNPVATPATENDSINLKRILFKFLQNWYWFVLTVVIAVSLGFLYNRFATPVYEINSSILVEEEKGSSSLGAGMNGLSQNVFQGLGGMGSMQNIYNQMVVLNSTPLVSRTLNELDFEVSYFEVNRMTAVEKYKEVPFQVIWDKNHPQVINADFNLEIEPDGKLFLTVEGEEVSTYSYTDEEIIEEIPEISFTTSTEAGQQVKTDEFSF